MSVLDKPAVDTDIEHLDFPQDDVACEMKDPRHSDPMTATHRWVLSCGHGGLVCEGHATLIRQLSRMGDGIGWCTLSKPKHLASTVTLEPIHT